MEVKYLTVSWKSNRSKMKLNEKKYLETNENRTKHTDLWGTAKVGIRGKFISINVYLKKIALK